MAVVSVKDEKLAKSVSALEEDLIALWNDQGGPAVWGTLGEDGLFDLYKAVFEVDGDKVKAIYNKSNFVVATDRTSLAICLENIKEVVKGEVVILAGAANSEEAKAYLLSREFQFNLERAIIIDKATLNDGLEESEADEVRSEGQLIVL